MDVWTHAGTGTVTRSREEFVVHDPHYDKDPIGPSSAILLGNYKLIRAYEDGSLRLFDLPGDMGKRPTGRPVCRTRPPSWTSR